MTDLRRAVDPDVRAAYAEDASGLRLLPEAVWRPRDAAELAAIVRDCAARGEALTPAGMRTSTVGGPLAARGAVLSLERLNRVLDIDSKRGIAVAEPGVILADLKAAIEGAGAYYPPDPTSEEECSLGGTVATNASGARTLRWGATRNWVRGLRVVLANGERLELTGGRHRKSTAGYWGLQDPLDLFVGSEGTLGVIERIEIALLPTPPPFFGAFAFFPSLAEALGFVRGAREAEGANPRCLELLDATALDIIRPAAAGLEIPGEARAVIFFEADAEGARSAPALPLEAWSDLLAAHGALVDATALAFTAARKRALRRLRHLVPSTLNEWAAAHREAGGRKISTDFAVPPTRLVEMLSFVDRVTQREGVDLAVRYGHVGDGHPHVFLRGRDADEVARLLDVAEILCREAVRLGGTVVAEHGVGKVKQRFLPLQHTAPVLAAMRAVKRSFDPDGRLAPGNVFPDDPPGTRCPPA